MNLLGCCYYYYYCCYSYSSYSGSSTVLTLVKTSCNNWELASIGIALFVFDSFKKKGKCEWDLMLRFGLAVVVFFKRKTGLCAQTLEHKRYSYYILELEQNSNDR